MKGNSLEEKRVILDRMHELLAYNVRDSIAYFSRYNGFIGELHFSSWFRDKPGYTAVEGGMFIPLVDTSNSFKEAIYVLVVSNLDEKEFYLEQLELSKSLATRGQYLVTYDPKESLKYWEKVTRRAKYGLRVEVHYPSSLSFQKYTDEGLLELSLEEFEQDIQLSPSFLKRTKIETFVKEHFINKLYQYSYEDLLQTYINRFILDGICTQKKLEKKAGQRYLGEVTQRGAPLDVDAFAKREGDDWGIFEIKEKDLTYTRQFGMDKPRIESLKKLSQAFNRKSYYLVRHINDQENRDFLDWQIIPMTKFVKNMTSKVYQGGRGMGGAGLTQLCNIKHFKRLE